MPVTLYYVHDPMCSWCWAFKPVWDHVTGALGGNIPITRLLGGLAPDSDEPMPEAMQRMLQDTWRNIQVRVPGTDFNYDFWENCKPRRSTYPACRAVIAASQQGKEFHEAMTGAIQRAYYLEARNPSDESTLVELSEELGLDAGLFSRTLNSGETRDEFERHIAMCHGMRVPGFPSLIVGDEKLLRRVPVEFNDPNLQVRLIQDAAA